jgi:hypothetical protein
MPLISAGSEGHQGEALCGQGGVTRIHEGDNAATITMRLQASDVFKRRDGQLYAILSPAWAAWLYPGATVDVSVNGGSLLIRGLSHPDRPKSPTKRVRKIRH